jgi:hypothetical protein
VRTVLAVWVMVAIMAAYVAGVLTGRLLPALTADELIDGYRAMVVTSAHVRERPADPGPLWPEDYLDRGHGSVPAKTKGHGS